MVAEYGVSYENTRVDSNNATSTKRNPRRVYHEVNPTRRDIEEVRCADHDQPRLGYIKPSGKKLSSTSSYTSKSSSPYYPKKKLPYIAPIAQEYGSSIASITIHESGSVHSYGVPIANGGENNFRHNRIKKQSTSDGNLCFKQTYFMTFCHLYIPFSLLRQESIYPYILIFRYTPFT